MTPLSIGIIGLVVGVIGTGFGGVLIGLTGKPSEKSLSFYLGFAGGIMLAIVFAELIPEAIEEGSLMLAMIGLILGVILLLGLDNLFPHVHHGGTQEGDGKLTKLGILLALGIAIHNFPEGIAIGAGYASQASLGLGLSIVLALHNIPEGIAMAVPLVAGGTGVSRMILATLLAGVPVGLGALIGAWIGNISPVFLSLSLGFAAGAMLYISFDELLPEAHIHSAGSHVGIYGGVIGVILGYILVSVI